eukprot:CAMPEP_0202685864 /NCGR_PEP_ID=MMETSP1385-20130828/1699_1 /ASSEMBLY_ACC=CAM_ASM_000861 /TAXON_ID=933848 /ORGANISM="Elphidium margaritaceum" /LENGTH=262 /DNA_ID=CAMNT_0049340331 /DNA_START=60 /DNA_END=848 /DNA_ORIENTATION=+
MSLKQVTLVMALFAYLSRGALVEIDTFTRLRWPSIHGWAEVTVQPHTGAIETAKDYIQIQEKEDAPLKAYYYVVNADVAEPRWSTVEGEHLSNAEMLKMLNEMDLPKKVHDFPQVSVHGVQMQVIFDTQRFVAPNDEHIGAHSEYFSDFLDSDDDEDDEDSELLAILNGADAAYEQDVQEGEGDDEDVDAFNAYEEKQNAKLQGDDDDDEDDEEFNDIYKAFMHDADIQSMLNEMYEAGYHAGSSVARRERLRKAHQHQSAE